MPKSKSRKEKKRKPSGPVSPNSPSESVTDKKCKIDKYFLPENLHLANVEQDADNLSEASFCTVDEPVGDSAGVTTSTYSTTLEPAIMPLSKDDIRQIAESVKALLLPELRSEIRSDIHAEIKEQVKSLHVYVDSAVQPLKDSIGVLQTQNAVLKNQVAELEPLRNQVAVLTGENVSLKVNIDELELGLDHQEQYSRRDCLRINGVLGDTGEHSEDTDAKLLQMAASANIPLLPADIDKSHRLGKPRVGLNRTVIVKFANSKSRDRVLNARKDVGGIYINEDISRYRQDLSYEARKLVRAKKLDGTWVGRGGVIYAKLPGGEPFKISSKSDMKMVQEGKKPETKYARPNSK